MTTRTMVAAIATAWMFAACGGAVDTANAPLDAAGQDGSAPNGEVDASSDATQGDATLQDGSAESPTDATVSSDANLGIDAGAEASVDAGGDVDAATDAASEDAADAYSGPLAYFRFANLASDDGDYDFCYAPVGGAWTGPWAYPANILVFGSVTPYVPVPAGTSYVVRVLMRNGTCDAADAAITFPDLTTDVLASGDLLTVTATGDYFNGDPHVLHAFHDDPPSAVPAGQVLVRVLDMAPSLATVNFGYGAGAAYLPMIDALGFAQVPTAASVVSGEPIDARGYVTTRPWASAIDVRSGGVEIAASAPIASTEFVGSGSLVTVYLAGRDGSASTPTSAITCFDDGVSGPSCTNVQELATGFDDAIVNAAPGAPPLDACFKLHAADAYTNAPALLAAGASGVPYAAQSRTMSLLPWSGDFDVKMITASSAATCADPAVAEMRLPYGGGNRYVAIQTAFGGAPVYAALPASADWQSFSGSADVEFVYAMTSGASYDVFAAWDGDAWAPSNAVGVSPGGQGELANVAAGTYQLQLQPSDPSLPNIVSPPVTFASDTADSIYWFASSASTTAFLYCNAATAEDASIGGAACTLF